MRMLNHILTVQKCIFHITVLVLALLYPIQGLSLRNGLHLHHILLSILIHFWLVHVYSELSKIALVDRFLANK